jgi:hypothetical protein
MNLHTAYKTEAEYYKPIEDLVGKTINYCGMDCKVELIAKYVKPEHFNIVNFRCVYVLKIQNPSEKQLNEFEDGYLYASSRDIMYSHQNFTNPI